MPNPETSMPTKRKNPEACGVSGPKCISLAMKSGKSRSNPPSRKDDPTINLNGFCRATLLRRREKSFEHDATKSTPSFRAKSRLQRSDEAFNARPGFPFPSQTFDGCHRDPSTSLRMTDLCDHNKFSRYIFRSNGAKSSSFSPVPTKRVGIPSSSWIATTMPPLPLPSSLVTIRPVSPSALWNSRA